MKRRRDRQTERAPGDRDGNVKGRGPWSVAPSEDFVGEMREVGSGADHPRGQTPGKFPLEDDTDDAVDGCQHDRQRNPVLLMRCLGDVRHVDISTICTR